MSCWLRSARKRANFESAVFCPSAGPCWAPVDAMAAALRVIGSISALVIRVSEGRLLTGGRSLQRLAHEPAQHVEAFGMQPAHPGLREANTVANRLQCLVVKIVLLDQQPVVRGKFGDRVFEMPDPVALQKSVLGRN